MNRRQLSRKSFFASNPDFCERCEEIHREPEPSAYSVEVVQDKNTVNLEYLCNDCMGRLKMEKKVQAVYSRANLSKVS